MGDSSPPQLRAPAPRAGAPSAAWRATQIPRLRPPPQIVTVRPLAFRRDSSRTQRRALPLVKQLLTGHVALTARKTGLWGVYKGCRIGIAARLLPLQKT